MSAGQDSTDKTDIGSSPLVSSNQYDIAFKQEAVCYQKAYNVHLQTNVLLFRNCTRMMTCVCRVLPNDEPFDILMKHSHKKQS